MEWEVKSGRSEFFQVHPNDELTALNPMLLDGRRLIFRAIRGPWTIARS
jgi:hypothetical protein